MTKKLTFDYGHKHLDNPLAYRPTEPKQYRVFICMPPAGTIITNKLEGSTYTVGANGRKDVVISGTAGEMWCAPIEKVLAKYRRPDGTSLHDYIAKNFGFGSPIFDWLEVEVIPGSVKNFALFIPIREKFSIPTAWGAMLDVNHPRCKHAEGDFIVCAVGADGKPNLGDRWVVNGEIFKKTYTMRGKFAELNRGSQDKVVTLKPTKSLIPKSAPKSKNPHDGLLVAVESAAGIAEYTYSRYNDSSCGVFVPEMGKLLCVKISFMGGYSVMLKADGCKEITKEFKAKNDTDAGKQIVASAARIVEKAVEAMEQRRANS